MSQPSVAGIGHRIARYRKINRWSARQLAENTDGAVTRDTIANIENGRRADITVRQFLNIALALRVPLVALLIDLEHPLDPSDIAFPGSAPAPLEPAAPHIAVATWLNGQTDDDTTPAGRWVTRTTALVAEYLAALDTAAANDALKRIAAAPPHREGPTVPDGRDAWLLAELDRLGVHLPADTERHASGQDQ